MNLSGGTRTRMGRTILLILGLALALFTASWAGLYLGSGNVTPSQVTAALTGAANPSTTAVVLELRLPRTLIGLVVGAALGLAGGLTQLHTRNPLADPGLIGVTAGAGFGVVAALAVLDLRNPATHPWFALIGALVAGAVVLALTARITVFEPMTTLVLTGAVVSALLGSATTAVVLMFPDTMKSFQFWSVGALADRPLSALTVALPFILLGLLLALCNLPAWLSLELGENLAASLGRPVLRDRLVGLGAVVLLASGATSVAGSVGFLGLLAPHLANRLLPGSPTGRVLLAAPLGALLLVVADIAGRVVLPTGEVSVGIMLAIVGAPLFVIIARRITR